jgi:hypothetical protein
MKSKIAVFSAAIITVGIFISTLSIMQHQAKAADNACGETYKLIDANNILDSALDGGPTALESKLNVYGAMGWKVRATTGRYIILAR